MKNFLKKIWEAIKRLIASIPEDKAWHFVVNFALAMSGFISYWLAVGLCVGASLGKEYGDSKAPAITGAGGDLLADFLGAACGLVVVWAARTLIGY